MHEATNFEDRRPGKTGECVVRSLVRFERFWGRLLAAGCKFKRNQTNRDGEMIHLDNQYCYLVDPASSRMLVSKIKPCM